MAVRARILGASPSVETFAGVRSLPLPDGSLEQLARVFERLHSSFQVQAAVVDGLEDPSAVEFALRAAGVPCGLFGGAIVVVVSALTRGRIQRRAPEVLEAVDAAYSNYSAPARNLIFSGRVLPLSQRAHVMGIVNVTPDSFSDGGRFFDPEAAIKHGLRLVDEGADLLDVGGESTRPGADPVPVGDEIARVVPVIEALAEQTDVPISVDTMKAPVAAAALDAGASIVNDVAAGRFDPEILSVAAERRAPIVLMHMLGEPRTMQQDPRYADVVGEIYAFLADRAEAAQEAGVSAERIVIDPGFGFGKTKEHNLVLLRRLREFTCLGYPILAGTSRKSFIGLTLDLPVEERLEGTAATVALSVRNGAAILRVHEVAPMRRVAGMVEAVVRATDPGEP